MQKVILFLLPLFLGGGCAFANGHTPEQLAKAQEIARDVSPDLYEQYKDRQTFLQPEMGTLERPGTGYPAAVFQRCRPETRRVLR